MECRGMMNGVFFTFTDPGDAVENVATAALTAKRAHKVNAAMVSTGAIRLLAFIDV